MFFAIFIGYFTIFYVFDMYIGPTFFGTIKSSLTRSYWINHFFETLTVSLVAMLIIIT